VERRELLNAPRVAALAFLAPLMPFWIAIWRMDRRTRRRFKRQQQPREMEQVIREEAMPEAQREWLRQRALAEGHRRQPASGGEGSAVISTDRGTSGERAGGPMSGDVVTTIKEYPWIVALILFILSGFLPTRWGTRGIIWTVLLGRKRGLEMCIAAFMAGVVKAGMKASGPGRSRRWS
jgi:hypothetical protein